MPNLKVICDCENLGTRRLYKNEPITREKEYRTEKYFELENGTWLNSMGDGRYYDDGGNAWSTVETLEYDDADEFVDGVEFHGFTML